MKQLLPLFLFLLPCLAWAQYPSNGNQKITLGEQTTADGLIWRGVLADTGIINPASDTSAYIILDTVNHRFYNYNRATNVWSVAGGGTAVTSITGGTGLTGGTITSTGTLAADTNFLVTRYDTSAMLTPYWRADRFSGVLPVANGGTGASSFTPNNYLIRTNSSGIFDTSAIYETGGNVRIGTTANSTVGSLTNSSLYIKQIANGATGGGLHIEQNDTTNVAFFGFNNTAFRIGTSYRTTGFIKPIEFFANVGIGTNNPTGSFEVYKSSGGGSVVDVARFGGNNGYATFNNYGDLQGTYGTTVSSLTAAYTTNTAGFGTFSNSDLAIVTNNARRITVKDGGNVGIGTASPLALLNVMGTVRINSASAPDANYYLQLENSSSQKAKANAWDTYSDSRIKTNRQPIINAIDKINLLNPTYYNQHDSYVEDDLLNIDYNNSYKSLGFIAQEVYEVIPEAVNMGTTNELWAMDYTKLIPILTKAIQEQQALIKALEQRIINLENK